MATLATLLQSPEQRLSGAAIVLLFVFVFLLCLYRYSTWSNVSKIRGIPEVPGDLPFVGHLHLLGGTTGKCDATVWTDWFHRWGWKVFQLRYGNERVVVANTYDTIKEIWVGNQSALNDRPIAYVYENHIGRDMGASPWTEECKRQRSAAIKSVAPGTWKSHLPILDKQSRLSVDTIREDSQNGAVPVELRKHLSRVAMNLGFSLAYGRTCEEVGGDEFLHGFIRSAAMITDVRVGSSNWIDYIPFLQVLPSSTVMRAKAGVQERKPYLDRLYATMKEDWEAGRNTTSIGASLLTAQTAKGSKITDEDIKQTCIAMLQGSSETISGTLTCGIGSLCENEAGLRIQDEAYEAILERWGTAEAAFENAFQAEDIPIVVALYKEMLRYYCVVPYSLPRVTSREVKLKDGSVIPKGVTMYMNAEGGNHDPEFYGEDAMDFNPYRFMDPNSHLSTVTLPHFSYGAGSRICPALQISNRILYAMIIRLLVRFRFVASEESPPNTHPTKYNTYPEGAVAKLAPYKAWCKPRQSQTRTAKPSAVPDDNIAKYHTTGAVQVTVNGIAEAA